MVFYLQQHIFFFLFFIFFIFGLSCWWRSFFLHIHGGHKMIVGSIQVQSTVNNTWYTNILDRYRHAFLSLTKQNIFSQVLKTQRFPSIYKYYICLIDIVCIYTFLDNWTDLLFFQVYVVDLEILYIYTLTFYSHTALPILKLCTTLWKCEHNVATLPIFLSDLWQTPKILMIKIAWRGSCWLGVLCIELQTTTTVCSVLLLRWGICLYCIMYTIRFEWCKAKGQKKVTN